jgi:hypothetical protein
MTALSMIQANLNNASNAITDLASNEINYEFKVKDILRALYEQLKNTSMNETQFKLTNEKLNETRLRFRQKTADAVSFVNAKFKIMYNKRHKSLMLKVEDKAFLKLHKEYALSEKFNVKLFNQRCESFLIKRKIERLVYELELSSA